MRVPLAAHRVNKNDTQYVDVWSNGKRIRERAPFLPYAYTRRKVQSPSERVVPVTVRPLKTLEPETWYRHDFTTVLGVSELNKISGTGGRGDSNVPFVERVLIDEPEWFTRYPNTDDLRIMYLDIEQLSSGQGFPTDRDPLIAISWAVNDGEPEVVMGNGTTDRDILQAFLDAVQRLDPDIFCGYNISGYDMPMLLKRIAANRLDATVLGRSGRNPLGDEVVQAMQQAERGGNDDAIHRALATTAATGRGGAGGRNRDEVFLDGRLIYDVFDSVKLDQTLYGIKDLKLKTVGAWMKYPIIKEDTSDLRALVNTPRLAEYNKNDVKLTRSLANIYFKNYVSLAEFYGAPLNVILRATPAFHMTILQGRVFRQADPIIISDGKNDDRYADLYEKAGGQAFVGGIVEIYKRGVFRPCWKVDFSSMYPSIMVSLGAGADNTRLLRSDEPIGPFLVEHDGDRRVYHIPDESRNVNLVIEIVGQSPMAEELKRLLNERMKLKKLAKETEDADERERLHATQNAIKVILNSVYGVHASSFARYGSLPVAVATVGVARRLIRILEGQLGDSKIETDTDGVYTSEPVEKESINDVIAEFVNNELGGENYAKVDVDAYAAAYFHERKSYLLLHDDGRIEKHGVAFKGSSLSAIFDKSLDRVAKALLNEGEGDPIEIARECLDIDRYAPEDFIMRIRLGKDLTDYTAGTPLGKQVGEAYRKATGRTPVKGEQLEYVKTTTGYDIPNEAAYARLDKAYYRSMVEGLLERLSIDWRPTKQMSLSEWF